MRPKSVGHPRVIATVLLFVVVLVAIGVGRMWAAASLGHPSAGPMVTALLALAMGLFAVLRYLWKPDGSDGPTRT